ncbi:MAG: hypothetical protein AAF653_16190, partial [Chloroflexota bacterium]
MNITSPQDLAGLIAVGDVVGRTIVHMAQQMEPGMTTADLDAIGAAFLKDHGSRTSQAKALLDVLANIGTPAALQVLLQTADRLKQKSVQAHAAKLIDDVADR